MSGEIKVTARLQVKKGSLDLPVEGPSSLAVDMAGSAGGVPGIVLAATDADGTTVATTGITEKGWCLMRNTHSSAIVTVGVIVAATFHPFAEMKPGEPCLFRMLDGSTYAIKSDTANSPVRVSIVDN